MKPGLGRNHPRVAELLLSLTLRHRASLHAEQDFVLFLLRCGRGACCAFRFCTSCNDEFHAPSAEPVPSKYCPQCSRWTSPVLQWLWSGAEHQFDFSHPNADYPDQQVWKLQKLKDGSLSADGITALPWSRTISTTVGHFRVTADPSSLMETRWAGYFLADFETLFRDYWSRQQLDYQRQLYSVYHGRGDHDTGCDYSTSPVGDRSAD